MSLSKFDNLWKLMVNHNFENVENIPDGVLCFICGKLLIEPYTGPCGHQFCNRCIREYLASNNTFCPGNETKCKEEILEIEKNLLKDFRARQNILKVNVTCSNILCSFVSTLENMEDHIRICTNKSINCPYETMGCISEGIKEGCINDHLYVNCLAHSQLLVEAVNHLKNEVDGLRRAVDTKNDELNKVNEARMIDAKEMYGLRLEVTQLKEDRDRDRNDLEEERRVIREYIANGKQQEGIMNPLLERNVDLPGRESKNDGPSIRKTPREATNTNVAATVQKTKEREEMGIDYVRREMKLDIESADVNISMRELNVIHDFVWHLHNFSRLTEETVNSTPFYKENYKFCLCIQIGRFDICLSFCIMKGEMDHLAKWPLRHTVVLHVINQSTMQAHTSDKYNINSHMGNKSVFGRPKNFTNAAIGVRWIPLNDLHNVRGLLACDSLMVCCSLLSL